MPTDSPHAPPPPPGSARPYRSRGRPSQVTQSDVHTAGIALLGRGEKPSVEKVIAITGGSPHTVGPLLEEFWQLLARVAQLLGSSFDKLPGDLPSLAQAFFIATLDEAYKLVRKPSAERHAELESRADDLDVRAQALQLAEKTLLARLKTQDEQLEGFRTQLKDQTSLMRQLMDARDGAEKQVRALHKQRDDLMATVTTEQASRKAAEGRSAELQRQLRARARSTKTPSRARAPSKSVRRRPARMPRSLRKTVRRPRKARRSHKR